LTRTHSANGGGVDDAARPINPVGRAQAGEQHLRQRVPDARLLPGPQASPATHTRAAAHFLRQHLPRDAALQDKQDAGQNRSIIERIAPRILVPTGLGGGEATVKSGPTDRRQQALWPCRRRRSPASTRQTPLNGVLQSEAASVRPHRCGSNSPIRLRG